MQDRVCGKAQEHPPGCQRTRRGHPGVHERRTCRGLYNWLVMRLRDGKRWHVAQVKACLAECRASDPDLHAVYGKRLSEVYFRLDKAMKAFFRRVKQGRRRGSPGCAPGT